MLTGRLADRQTDTEVGEGSPLLAEATSGAGGTRENMYFFYFFLDLLLYFEHVSY